MKKKKPSAQKLVAAINRQNLDLLRTLLEVGADPNAHEHDDYHGDYPILLQAAGGLFTEGVEALLKAGADPNAAMSGGTGTRGGGRTALHAAISGSDGRPDDDPSRRTEEDRFRIVDMLLKAGANPNAVDQGSKLPLYEAASGGCYEIVQRLVEAGATFKTWPLGCTPPLVGAVNFGNLPEGKNQESIAELLLNLGAPVDGEEESTGMTALMSAALVGSEHLVNVYLDRGADVNHRSKDGRTPFLCAAAYAQNAATERQNQLALRILKRLVEAGADPNARNTEGQTAYDIATRFRMPLAADYLKGLCTGKTK